LQSIKIARQLDGISVLLAQLLAFNKMLNNKTKKLKEKLKE
jgi:hypothetical protein